MSNKSGTDLINEAKQRIREVSAADVKRTLDAGKKPVLLDVREPNETNLGRIPGAVVIPRGTMEGKIEAAVPRDADLVVYCASGNRSALAADVAGWRADRCRVDRRQSRFAAGLLPGDGGRRLQVLKTAVYERLGFTRS